MFLFLIKVPITKMYFLGYNSIILCIKTSTVLTNSVETQTQEREHFKPGELECLHSSSHEFEKSLTNFIFLFQHFPINLEISLSLTTLHLSKFK